MDYMPLSTIQEKVLVFHCLRSLPRDVSELIWKMSREVQVIPNAPILTRRPKSKLVSRLQEKGRKSIRKNLGLFYHGC